MSIRTLCTILLILGFKGLSAQNPRLSQVWTTPMNVNPALSGRFDGMAKLGTLYSWQKSNPISGNDSTVKMSHQNIYFDFKFGKYRHIGDEEQYAIRKDSANIKPRVEAKDETGLERKNLGYWSAGVNYYHYGDNSNPFKADFFSATIARHFYIKHNRYYGFGLQASYAHANLDSSTNLNYDSEISGGAFHYNLGQSQVPSTKGYLDFGLGGYYGMATEPVSFELGFAMYHLFYPKISLDPTDNDFKLRHRVTAHSLLRLKLDDKWGFIQRNIYWEEGLYLRSRVFNGDNTHIVAFYSGVELYKTHPRSNYNLNFGLYTRSFKTVMPFVNINLGRMANLRYSYEFPFNSRIYAANNAKRSELVLLLTYKRYTPPGLRFSRKVNYW